MMGGVLDPDSLRQLKWGRIV